MATELTPSERDLAILDETSTADLVKEAMDEAKELVRLEVALAKEEVKAELKQVSRAAVSFGVALAAALIVLSLLAMAIVLALGATTAVALAVAAAFLAVAVVAGSIGYGMLPKAPMEKTRLRLESDVNQLKEHIA